MNPGMPTTIADNAGYDSGDLVTQLRAAHYQGQTTAGLDMNNGIIGYGRVYLVKPLDDRRRV